MASALGMAGTQSAGLWAFTADGAMSKRFHPGRASQSGVMSALLARKGFRGPTQILEAADGGFCRATSDRIDLSQITQGLGTRFLCRDVNIKPYACCASAHSAIDAVLQIREKHRFSPSEVERIRVKTAEGVKLQCGFEYRAMSAVQAQMSLQYIVAVSLLDGQALLGQFSEARIAEPQVMALAARVEIVTDPEMDKLYPRLYANKVEILLKSGRRFEMRVDSAKGSTESPMNFQEIAGKFRSLAGPVIAADRLDALIEMVEGMERLDDIRKLTRLLA
jgi:2-methylcitrate dehydratase PrpD